MISHKNLKIIVKNELFKWYPLDSAFKKLEEMVNIKKKCFF
jgi:hypothetical protein